MLLRNKDLIELLKRHDPELHLVITRDGKGHEYGINKDYVEEIDHAYFGNDPESEQEFKGDDKFLRIGLC